MAYNCDYISGGLSLSCRNSMGGLQTVYLQAWDKVSATTLNSSYVITGITYSSTATTGFYEFQFENETAQWSDGGKASNVGNYVEQTLSLQFLKSETAKRNQIALLSIKPMVAIVKDNNGKYFYLGRQFGLKATEYTQGSGKAAGELNGYTINFMSMEPEMAHEISASTFSYS